MMRKAAKVGGKERNALNQKPSHFLKIKMKSKSFGVTNL